MPLINETYDSLPYIDADPTPTQRASAQSLIDAELSTMPPHAASTHAQLPPGPDGPSNPFLLAEHARIAASTPLRAIDLTRYEAPSAPATLAQLAAAHVASTYLAHRVGNLETLGGAGRDEWLAGNEGVLAVLTRVEAELQAAKAAVDELAVRRRDAQERVRGEMDVLELSWKRGVGRVLETEVAAEGVRREVLERRRGAA